MLRIVALSLQGLLASYLVYELVVSLWGWPGPKQAATSARSQRFRIVIPAHNEERVIGGILSDLAAQEYEPTALRVVVVADRCTDGTAEAAARSVEVAQRETGAGGKGAALDWYLSLSPLDGDEALVVFDADTRLPPDALGRVADELGSGHEVCQLYLDIENPAGSLLATASALSYWAGNRMVQLARHNLGWSADLGGTGMVLSARAAAVLGSFGGGLTEDQSALADLTIAGFRVRWLHDVRLRDEKPEHVAVAVRQRARWVAGKRSVARRRFGPLLRSAVVQRSWAPVDVAIRLVQPGRSFLALVAALLAIAAAVWSPAFLFSWQIWGAIALATFLSPIAFLLRDGVPLRYVVRYPLVALLALLWLPIRIASRVGAKRWQRTPRSAERA